MAGDRAQVATGERLVARMVAGGTGSEVTTVGLSKGMCACELNALYTGDKYQVPR